jgi:hypothetical protein
MHAPTCFSKKSGQATGSGDLPVALDARARREGFQLEWVLCDRSPQALANAQLAARKHAMRHHITSPTPGGVGGAEAMRLALSDARLAQDPKATDLRKQAARDPRLKGISLPK